MRYVQYGFPECALAPGERRTIEAQPRSAFRPSQIVMAGFMDVIRGHFQVKRSRLPSLDRDDVFSYSTVSRYPSRRRTVVAFTHPDHGRVARTYLPSSVTYFHVDPLSYVVLEQIACDRVTAMSSNSVGLLAKWFGPDNLGVGIPLPTARTGLALCLRNIGDVTVKVYTAMMGTEY